MRARVPHASAALGWVIFRRALIKALRRWAVRAAVLCDAAQRALGVVGPSAQSSLLRHSIMRTNSGRTDERSRATRAAAFRDWALEASARASRASSSPHAATAVHARLQLERRRACGAFAAWRRAGRRQRVARRKASVARRGVASPSLTPVQFMPPSNVHAPRIRLAQRFGLSLPLALSYAGPSHERRAEEDEPAHEQAANPLVRELVGRQAQSNFGLRHVEVESKARPEVSTGVDFGARLRLKTTKGARGDEVTTIDAGVHDEAAGGSAGLGPLRARLQAELGSPPREPPPLPPQPATPPTRLVQPRVQAGVQPTRALLGHGLRSWSGDGAEEQAPSRSASSLRESAGHDSGYESSADASLTSSVHTPSPVGARPPPTGRADQSVGLRVRVWLSATPDRLLLRRRAAFSAWRGVTRRGAARRLARAIASYARLGALRCVFDAWSPAGRRMAAVRAAAARTRRARAAVQAARLAERLARRNRFSAWRASEIRADRASEGEASGGGSPALLAAPVDPTAAANAAAAAAPTPEPPLTSPRPTRAARRAARRLKRKPPVAPQSAAAPMATRGFPSAEGAQSGAAPAPPPPRRGLASSQARSGPRADRVEGARAAARATEALCCARRQEQLVRERLGRARVHLDMQRAGSDEMLWVRPLGWALSPNFHLVARRGTCNHDGGRFS